MLCYRRDSTSQMLMDELLQVCDHDNFDFIYMVVFIQVLRVEMFFKIQEQLCVHVNLSNLYLYTSPHAMFKGSYFEVHVPLFVPKSMELVSKL